MIEFIYAIVGIVWLTQYYTSCNDLTAKNVTLGMSVGPGVRGQARLERAVPGWRGHSILNPGLGASPMAQW